RGSSKRQATRGRKPKMLGLPAGATSTGGDTAMVIPLMMLGPGGDYTTRYDIKGRGLVRQAGATLGQQPDTDTAGSMASWGRMPRRRGQGQNPGDSDGAGPE